MNGFRSWKALLGAAMNSRIASALVNLFEKHRISLLV